MKHLKTFAMGEGRRYQDLLPDSNLVSPSEPHRMNGFRGLAYCFLTSRRRHTICLSDWSSDVCSSDLLSQSRSADHHRQSPPQPPHPSWLRLDRRRRGRLIGRIYLDPRIAYVPQALLCVTLQDRKSTRLNSSHLGISYAV